MQAADFARKVRDGLSRRRLRLAIGRALALPPLVALGLAAHFWSTAGRLGSYRPAEPSRLYAAPLELRAGAPYVRSALVADLRSLGYRAATGEVGTGEFAFSRGTLRIGLRPQVDDGGAGALGGGMLEVAPSGAASERCAPAAARWASGR